jgi:hypothetical protein
MAIFFMFIVFQDLQFFSNEAVPKDVIRFVTRMSRLGRNTHNHNHVCFEPFGLMISHSGQWGAQTSFTKQTP